MRGILLASALLLLASTALAPSAAASPTNCVIPDSFTLPAGPKTTVYGPGIFATDGTIDPVTGLYLGTTVVATCVAILP
jgi:hypothetical protein